VNTDRLSACSIALHGQPLDHTLDVIAAAGFRKVDLLGRPPHFSLDASECDPADVQAAAQSRGLQIANLGTYVGAGFASEDAAIQEHEWQDIQRAVDLAAYFGARSIRVRPGSDDPACLDRITPWFQRSAEYAAKRGVYLGFENHGGGISGRPALCRELADRVGSSYFGVLYEPCNLMHAGVDYRYALHVMSAHIVHVHLKDGAFSLQGFEHTLLGQGQIDFGWVLAQLAALDYRGDLALEYELSAPPPEEGLRLFYESAAVILSGYTAQLA
jgi:sugar phosphate isomerase/epimerase